MRASLAFPIDTSRLRLRKFEAADLDDVCEYALLPDAQRYLASPCRDRADLKRALQQMAGQHTLHRPGDSIWLAAERQSDGRLVGQVALIWTDATAGQGELRLAFNPIVRRQGLASEAARAVLDFGFEELRLHRIFARCDVKNPAPARLLKGLGMRLEAHYREHVLFQGEWDEELHFAILDREWRRGEKVKELTRHMVA
jgi:RimJ/RimL family protein N-acetyltransferase